MSDHSAAASDHEAPTTVATAPVTVDQAAAVLGVSVTTVRRRIRDGSLRAEEARRPQGPVWLVYLPADATAATTEPPPATSTVATAATSTKQADAMVSLIQTTIGTILGPLVGQIDAQRQTIERQADHIEALARENGHLTAELAAVKASQTPAVAQPEPPRAALSVEPPVSTWQRLTTLALVLAAIVATVLLLMRWPW